MWDLDAIYHNAIFPVTCGSLMLMLINSNGSAHGSATGTGNGHSPLTCGSGMRDVDAFHHNEIFPVACGPKSDSTPSLEAVWVLSNNENADSKTESLPCQQVLHVVAEQFFPESFRT